MGVKVIPKYKGPLVETHGRSVYLKDVQLSGKRESKLSFTIATRSHKIIVHGVTVHKIFKTVFLNSDPELQKLIIEWMQDRVDTDNAEVSVYFDNSYCEQFSFIYIYAYSVYC